MRHAGKAGKVGQIGFQGHVNAVLRQALHTRCEAAVDFDLGGCTNIESRADHFPSHQSRD